MPSNSTTKSNSTSVVCDKLDKGKKKRDYEVDEEDMHKALAKENKKALVDLDIQNKLKGSYYSTHRIPALSEYSRQMMRDQSSQNSRALLRNLQNYEANSPFFERPELIAPVYERSLTSADLSVDPNAE